MVSTAASMTTMYFNKIFERKTREFVMENCYLMDSNDDFNPEENPNEELHRYVKSIRTQFQKEPYLMHDASMSQKMKSLI